MKKVNKLIKAAVLMLFVFASTHVLGQEEGDDYGFPAPIDVAVQRENFSITFPNIDETLKTRAGLKKYIREVDLYRISTLEAYNYKILSICKRLVETELRVNKAWANSNVSGNEKKRYDLRIKNEREQCDVKFYKTSKYYKLYDDFLNFYREQVKDAQKELAICDNSEPCRTGAH